MKRGFDALSLPVARADFPQVFPAGLEFSPPARGVWNIVHTSMLLPGSHQIYVCARGCLRGVILTAAEMNAMDRMSWVSVEERDFFDNSMESCVIDGVTKILHKLPRRPRAVWVYLSCIQLFAGVDFPLIIRELEARFPEIVFIDALMHPTMRKSGLTPDQFTRRQLFSALEAPERFDRHSVNLLGSDFPADRECELFPWLEHSGFICRELPRCRTFDEYLEMGRSFLNFTWIPQAVAAGVALQSRLGQKHLHLPMCYVDEEIDRNYRALAEALDLPAPGFSAEREIAQTALAELRREIGETPVVLDYTASPRILSLARRLLEAGINVERIFADSFIPEDREDFEFLRERFPELRITPTLHVSMRFPEEGRGHGECLAIGQKAAFFTGTPRFADLVWGRGFYGFEGVRKIAELAAAAFREPKDLPQTIQHKGWGCESCL